MKPSRIRDLPPLLDVLVVGGGIHGAGIVHDLSSRGYYNVALFEKGRYGEGTSSRSTKLIHGGLRYLKRIKDYSLVREALLERKLLMELAPDLVHPTEMIFPIIKDIGMPGWMVKTGLSLYDVLAGSKGLHKHKRVGKKELEEKVCLLNTNTVTKAYSFWDAQTDDLALVNRVAYSALREGAYLFERIKVLSLVKGREGFLVRYKTPLGEGSVRAKVVVNAAGPWAHQLLKDSGLTPKTEAVNNKGIHLLFDDLGLKSSLFLQSLKNDGRIFFMVPWLGQTLLGTTEDVYNGDLDSLEIREEEVQYLLDNVNGFLHKPLGLGDIKGTFAGLRWLAVEKGKGLSQTTRSHFIEREKVEGGLLITLYGGKLTTYRKLAMEVGGYVDTFLDRRTVSKTHLKEVWVQKEDVPDILPLSERWK